MPIYSYDLEDKVTFNYITSYFDKSGVSSTQIGSKSFTTVYVSKTHAKNIQKQLSDAKAQGKIIGNLIQIP